MALFGHYFPVKNGCNESHTHTQTSMGGRLGHRKKNKTAVWGKKLFGYNNIKQKHLQQEKNIYFL